MRSHRFINSPHNSMIQCVVQESKANENNGGIRCFFVLFIDKLYISQVIHFDFYQIFQNEFLKSAQVLMEVLSRRLPESSLTFVESK